MTATDPSSRDRFESGVVRWGGLSLFAAGAALVIFIVGVLVAQQPVPVPPQEMLESPGRPTLIFAVAALGEFLLMPAALGLYFALKDLGRVPMVFATAFWLLGVALFLASRGLIFGVA